MRSIPTALSNYLQTHQGLIQQLVVDVMWDDEWVRYDNDLIELGEVTQQVTQFDKTIGSVSVTIIAEGLDEIHYHKVPARIVFVLVDTGELLFEEAELVLFEGQVSSPFEIKDNKRVSFDIVSEIETMELGFSPDEGQLDFVPREFADVVWPLGFGFIQKAPAVKVKDAQSMILSTNLTLADPSLPQKIAAALEGFYYAMYMCRFWLSTIQLNEDKVDNLGAEVKVFFQAYRINVVEVQNAINDLQLKTNLHQQDPNNVFRKADMITAEIFLQNTINTANAALAALYTKLNRLNLLIEKNRYKRGATTKFLDAYMEAKEAAAGYHELVLMYCQQLQYQDGHQLVENSDDFEQNVEFDFFIKNVKFRGYVDGRDLYISEGPLNTYENVPLDPWTPDDEAICEPENESMNMFRCSTNLTNQYVLVKDVYDEYHIIGITGQIDNKVYFDLVRWEQDRVGRAERYDIDTVVGTLVEMPVAAVAMNAFPPNTIFSGSFDPQKWNRKETARYLQLISGLTNPTPEEKATMAWIAWLEPWDAVDEANLLIQVPTIRDTYTLVGPDIAEIIATSGMMRAEWLANYPVPYEEIQSNLFWQAEPGSTVVQGNTCRIYIVNCVPSTIYGVYGYRTNNNGERFLAPIPSRYYTKLENHNLGSMNVCALVFNQEVPGYEDEVFVTYESSVGPRITDILIYLIENYTDKTWDVESFQNLEAKFQDKYPANFVLYDRTDVLEEMQRIAREARCRLWMRDGVFYIKYLSERPVSVKTITGTTIVSNTTVKQMKDTEEIYTKYTAIWKPDYLPDTRERKIIVRYNVKRYGIREYQEEYHIFNEYDLVHKSATFWAIRHANTFKRIQVETTIDNLDLEINDSITYKGQLCTIIGWQYSKNGLILTLELPIRLGETEEYPYYWPSSLPADYEFPPANDDYAGGFGPNSNVTGTIPC
jgi:hypothetical protein